MTPYALKVTQEGIERVMVELGMLQKTDLSEPIKTRILRLTGKHNYVYARQDGLFEPSAEIGEDIDAGQTAGWIHQPEAPWEEAKEVVFPITATVLCKRIPGRVQPGDCLYQLGQDDTA